MITTNEFISLVKDFKSLKNKMSKRAMEQPRMDYCYADENLAEVAEELKKVKDVLKTLKGQEEHLKAIIANRMGDKTVLATEDGEVLATYKPSTEFLRVSGTKAKAQLDPKTYELICDKVVQRNLVMK